MSAIGEGLGSGLAKPSDPPGPKNVSLGCAPIELGSTWSVIGLGETVSLLMLWTPPTSSPAE